jgi:hypothetical protein
VAMIKTILNRTATKKSYLVILSILALIFISGCSSLKLPEPLELSDPHVLSIDYENVDFQSGEGWMSFKKDFVITVQNTGGSGRFKISLYIDNYFEEAKIVDIGKDQTVKIYFKDKSYITTSGRIERPTRVEIKRV